MRAPLFAALLAGGTGYCLGAGHSPSTIQRAVVARATALQQSVRSVLTGSYHETLTILDVEEIEKRRAERARLLAAQGRPI